MRNFRFKISKQAWIEMVYISIALTTLQHTAWAGSTVFEGTAPIGTSQHISFVDPWWLTGILMAISVDVGMFVVARLLTEARDRKTAFVLITTFLLLAASSFYFQILYAVSHTQIIAYANGVNSYWKLTLQPMIDARVVLVPLMLPLIGIMYTVAQIQQKQVDRDEQRVAEEAATQRRVWRATIINKESGLPQLVEAPIPMLPSGLNDRVQLVENNDELGYVCLVCGKTGNGYKTPQTRNGAVKSHFTSSHREFADWHSKPRKED